MMYVATSVASEIIGSISQSVYCRSQTEVDFLCNQV